MPFDVALLRAMPYGRIGSRKQPPATWPRSARHARRAATTSPGRRRSRQHSTNALATQADTGRDKRRVARAPPDTGRFANQQEPGAASAAPSVSDELAQVSRREFDDDDVPESAEGVGVRCLALCVHGVNGVAVSAQQKMGFALIPALDSGWESPVWTVVQGVRKG